MKTRRSSVSPVIVAMALLAVMAGSALVPAADTRGRSDRTRGSYAPPTSIHASTSPTDGIPAYKQNFRDRYSILSEQNIFLRDRRRPYTPSTTQTTRPSRTDGGASSPEAAYLLTGIVLEEGGVRAYVEDIKASKIVRLAVGENIARGTIGDIQIDAIAYDSAGQRTWISIGQNLAGATIVTAPAPSAAGSLEATAGATTAPSELGDPNDPTLSKEQRMLLLMKIRRAQELKPK